MLRSLVYIDNKAYLVDTDTGEVLAEAPDDGMAIWVKRRDVRKQPFVIVYQVEAERLATLEMKGLSWRIFWYLLSLTDFENKVLQKISFIAAKFKSPRQYVHKCLSELVSYGLIDFIEDEELPRHIKISPCVAWKGTLANQAKAINQDLTEKITRVPTKFNAKCICGSIIHSDSEMEMDNWIEAHTDCPDLNPEDFLNPSELIESQLGIE